MELGTRVPQFMYSIKDLYEGALFVIRISEIKNKLQISNLKLLYSYIINYMCNSYLYYVKLYSQ